MDRLHGWSADGFEDAGRFFQEAEQTCAGDDSIWLGHQQLKA